ncbi:hypothetical protein C2845_PM12G10060 [Panicum miliaceum]|uniref:Uncharacterized protein n=1 Tax=Panicum miliaceum TaxID=4540 RepID=A0A3L6QH52_PANMI|nr:hypothetical protein C2845_PM12G10060 [Panicum miliaceum]
MVGRNLDRSYGRTVFGIVQKAARFQASPRATRTKKKKAPWPRRTHHLSPGFIQEPQE